MPHFHARAALVATVVVIVGGATAIGSGCSGQPPDPTPRECEPGATQPCYSGPEATRDVGVCRGGTQLCAIDGKWGACAGQVLPDLELCNGADDDCNGQVDEGFGQVTCGTGACERTVDECEAGVPQTCIPGNPAPAETCEGTDDTCDGQVDEGCACLNGATQPCYPGAAATRGVGVCTDGVQTCAQGQWGTCTNAVVPSAETCNGLDDDCDGAADDGDPESGATCATGVAGVCSAGTTACDGGAVRCNQNVQASSELCDGLDNDCNGQADDGDPGAGATCTTSVPGVCANGTTVCSAGALSCAQTVQPSAETCDGLDNDCDGAADEGNPGGAQACTTELLGVCADGTSVCDNGSIVCTQNVQSSAESCDGLDNDCDGQVDEGNPGAGAACNTGLQGVCAAGTTSCSGGALTCTQNVQSSAEVCDGLDNDCDGTPDDGNPGGGASCSTGLQGVCAAGTLTCSSGALTCAQNVQSSAEACGDSVDNDCDGVVNDGCTTTCAHSTCTTGAALADGCDACVTQICAVDPYCCTTQWDAQCVGEVDTVCNSLKCAGACAHSPCVEGSALSATCNTCVGQICDADPYCCSTGWDSLCVGQLQSVCGKTCD